MSRLHFAATLMFLTFFCGIAHADSLLETGRKCKAADSRSCEKLQASCDKRVGEACEYLGVIAVDEDRIKDSIKFYELGCTYGSKFSCVITGIVAKHNESVRGDFEKIEKMQGEVAEMQAKSRQKSQPMQTPDMDGLGKAVGATQTQQESKQTNCTTQPVRDMYTNQIMNYRTVCH